MTVPSSRDSSKMNRSSTAAFTKLNLTLCNKVLHVQIIISFEIKPGCFFDCEPFDFSKKAPYFHRPSELDFCIKSTTDDFRNIFSKGLLEIFLLLKLTKTEWKQLMNDYEGYLKRR